MSKAPRSPADQLIAKLRKDLAELAGEARSAALTVHGRAKLNQEIAKAARELNDLFFELDPRERPDAIFDPGNPRTIGFFVALALTAQPRKPLTQIREFYGSGVYALYYRGNFPPYATLSGTETPIYVGQAAPGRENARTPEEQGLRLAARLNEHRKNIIRASHTLRTDDFDCRALVVQSGWESGAEKYLISLFKPIWNSEIKLVYGLGKHGDSAETRRNRRSPWDTLHAGRQWAAAGTLQDAKSAEKIQEELEKHFATTPVYKSMNDVLAAFVGALRQS